MNRFFLKVHGDERHCPGGFGLSKDAGKWEGRTIILPKIGPVLARKKDRKTHAEIRPGDELWIWTHEASGGKGMTARATVRELKRSGSATSVVLQNVEIVPKAFGYRAFPEAAVNGRETGSRFLDYASTQRTSAVYLLEEADFSDFIAVVEARGWPPPAIEAPPSGFSWRDEIRNHKDEILSELTERRLNWRKVRPVQGKFRDDLLDLYDGRCLLTRCAVPEAIEAAHVLPHNGDPVRDRPDNGLLLRRDLHTMFDAMLWSIDPKTKKVQLGRRLVDKSYGTLDGKLVDHQVNPDALLFHFTQFRKADRDE